METTPALLGLSWVGAVLSTLSKVSRLNYVLDGVSGNAFVKLLQRRV